MNTEWSFLSKKLYLTRYPFRHQHKSLQAWDAADELAIEHLTQTITNPVKRILLLNDDFGSLATWLSKPPYSLPNANYSTNVFHDTQIISCTDSFISQKSTEDNLADNHLKEHKVNFVDSLATLSDIDADTNENESTSKVPFTLDLVVLKIPRSLALLEHQLILIQKIATSNTVILATGKVKTVQSAVLKLFEQHLGTTTTSLAKKKARLIFCQLDKSKHSELPPPSIIEDDAIPFRLLNRANVFSRQQLDLGARLLLEHLPHCENKTIIDLGCGNGVLGVWILKHTQHAKVIFVDESFMAVASARDNVLATIGDSHRATFEVNNCLEGLLKQQHAPVDLIVCNPPFHQQNVVTDHVAYQMITESKKILKMGGKLLVVGNRHLDYPVKLKRIFGGYEDVASNAKFSVLQSTK